MPEPRGWRSAMSVLSPTRSTSDTNGSVTSTPASRTVSQHLRPRSSVAATIALAAGVAAILAVATGVFAVSGAVLGLVATLFAIGGIAATRQGHIAGTGNAALGLVLGLAALALGVLAATGGIGWLDPETNNV